MLIPFLLFILECIYIFYLSNQLSFPHAHLLLFSFALLSPSVRLWPVFSFRAILDNVSLTQLHGTLQCTTLGRLFPCKFWQQSALMLVSGRIEVSVCGDDGALDDVHGPLSNADLLVSATCSLLIQVSLAIHSHSTLSTTCSLDIPSLPFNFLNVSTTNVHYSRFHNYAELWFFTFTLGYVGALSGGFVVMNLAVEIF